MISAERLYRWGWGIVLFGLPLSNPLMSVGLLVFAAGWVTDRVQQGRMRPWSGTLGWSVVALGVFQVSGLLWSEDLTPGLHVLRNEGPLFAFLVLGATGRWDRDWAGRWVPLLLGGAVLVACAAMWSFGWWRESRGEFLRPRDWSPFISHVRFSLLVAWAAGWWTLLALEKRIRWVAPALLVAVGGLTVARTGSMTGILLLPVAVAAACVFEGRQRFIRIALGVAFGVAVVGGGWAAWMLRAVYPEADALETTSRRGGLYRHDAGRSLRENGTFVGTYLCEQELDSAWMARTGKPLSGLDARGQELRTTAIRHLSSLGLRKDADGVDALSEASIGHIYAGIPTVSELQHRGIRRRWDVLAFEWANHRDGGDPSGNSVLQRLEFARAAWHVIRQHPMLGVGTGDVDAAMRQAYVDLRSPLDPAFQLRPHNQYLTLWAASGLLASLAWLLAIAGLWRVPGPWRSPARVFALVLALSCLTEDTLESQAGATFAGVFMGMFSGARAAGPPPAPRPPRAPRLKPPR
jgi:hypothetical protein